MTQKYDEEDMNYLTENTYVILIKIKLFIENTEC